MSRFIQCLVITDTTPCTLTSREKIIYQSFTPEELERHYKKLFGQLVFVTQQLSLWRDIAAEDKKLSAAVHADDIKHPVKK